MVVCNIGFLCVFFDIDKCKHNLSEQIGNIRYIGKVRLHTNICIVAFTNELLVIPDLFSESECSSGEDLEYFNAEGHQAITCNDEVNFFIS